MIHSPPPFVCQLLYYGLAFSSVSFSVAHTHLRAYWLYTHTHTHTVHKHIESKHKSRDTQTCIRKRRAQWIEKGRLEDKIVGWVNTYFFKHQNISSWGLLVTVSVLIRHTSTFRKKNSNNFLTKMSSCWRIVERWWDGRRTESHSHKDGYFKQSTHDITKYSMCEVFSYCLRILWTHMVRNLEYVLNFAKKNQVIQEEFAQLLSFLSNCKWQSWQPKILIECLKMSIKCAFWSSSWHISFHFFLYCLHCEFGSSTDLEIAMLRYFLPCTLLCRITYFSEVQNFKIRLLEVLQIQLSLLDSLSSYVWKLMFEKVSELLSE